MMPADPERKSNPPRKAISRRLRYEILRRDNSTCRYCHATDTPLTIDHLVPVALGGTDDPSNLVAACKDCNAGKASSSPDAATVAQVSEDAVRWAAAVKFAAERATVIRDNRRKILEPLHDYWYQLMPNYKADDWRWHLPTNWEEVLFGLLVSGLTTEMVADCIRVALTTRGVDDRFRYFLGVARNQLAELHAEARKLIDDGAI